ncbi:ankyrin repeat and death domain-containing protein 1B isoform X2 [Denticeps clupeoides]|uniref:ankyrin repeat and death domain-containing protein 1B isoform X2 n=1 Tax=Denticeps clupeoides TaxID=299321 RepID=UPI0010A43545|nr:ankyrin repeat and death domain-containing protein 1B isoform X2 [Denticeps clupeoides]
MERRAQALRDRILQSPVLKTENLNPKKWLKSQQVKGFTDFVLQRDADEDNSGYDNVEMLLDVEKEYIEAAKRNDLATIKQLGKGVNINAKNVHHRTALHYAVAHKNVEVVDLLLRRRAKLDLQDKHGVTAIHLAAWFGSLEILKLLVQAGADQSVLNNEGMNMMHCAAINNHTEIMSYIINDLQMKELDKEDQRGNRPFAAAAEHGCVAMMHMLMEEQYNMATMEPNLSGDTPLHLAARSGQMEALQLLLDSFDVRDEVNHAGQTVLYLAAVETHEDCVQVLLSAGCDPNIPTIANTFPLHPINQRGHTQLVKLLIGNGAHINAQDQHQRSPLHLAVKNCHLPVIHTLLESECNVNLTDHMGQTPLHIAAEFGRVDVVEMILKADVALEIKDKQGKTALGVAARADAVVIVDMIIKAERYFTWRKNNHVPDGFLHNEFPLTFKLDHRMDTKEIRTTIWNLAYKSFKRNDWKKLAEHWTFTEEQVAAIEEQWTGPQSYQEHGNRMMLIWLHGATSTQRSPAKELYEGLLSIGNKKVAEKIRMEANEDEMRRCIIS